MCGIAGRFHPGRERLPAAPGWHQAADQILAHRGPDGSGHWADAYCELVHRRLALIDLSPAGAQPLTNETGDIWITFNGEIYNHDVLRALLQARGHIFRSRTDTETIVHLYEERGEGLVDFLRGIFAFALYDARRHRLLLARDRFGVKPLFFTNRGDQLVFASEIKAITALPGFRPTLDRQACSDYLGLSYVPEPATGFNEILALPPGSFLVAEDGRIRTQSYYTVDAQPNQKWRLEDAAERTAQRMVRAVQRQSVADVPVAALLSGGIDSSLVVAARARSSEATSTFNVRFPVPGADESPLARAVAEHYRTQHLVIEPHDWSLAPDALLGLMRHFGQPFADTSLIPMYWVSRAIREQGIICALSGDGGDEGFGGYNSFWWANRLAHLMRLPGWARTAVRRAGAALAPVTRDLGRQLAKATALASAGCSDSAVLLAGLANYLGEDQKAALMLPDAADELEPVYRHYDGFAPARARDLEELSRRMTNKMFAVGLPSQMLRKVDMMSMRASIEVRVPLLDEEVVAVGLSLPHRLKTDGHEGKLVLRTIAESWLPRSVARFPKHGFALPPALLASGALAAVCDDLLLGSEARVGWFLNRALIRDWVRRFRGASGDGGGEISHAGLHQRVFMLLSLELWMRDYGLAW
ncbi:MAG TPA: asparagine synthase (glutamine-hydrolyzing) [Gemmatimonadales bacterium]|nr:asparagine synthase (glutamine-hydrolyzing) [Gemmatimonadales bacterium]